MFKKKIVKRNNILEDFKQDPNGENPEHETEDNQEVDPLEPKLRKAVKKESQHVFSVHFISKLLFLTHSL